jgi:type II secretory pathway component PulF
VDYPLYAWPTLLILSFALRMALHLNYGARGPEDNDPIYVLLSTMSWVMLVAGIVPAMIVSGATLLGLVVIFLGIATMFEAIHARRGALRRTVAGMLALVAQRKGDLGLSVIQIGVEQRGIVGRALQRLTAELANGTPLAEAARRHPEALPAETPAFIAAGQELGHVSAALAELSRTEDIALSGLWRMCVDRLVYLAGVLGVMGIVVGFVMIRIAPQFRQIFQEFDMELPVITELLFFGVSNTAVRPLGMLILICIPPLILVVFAMGVLHLFEVPILNPILDYLFRARHRANVLRLLAMAADSRHDFASMFRRLRDAYPSWVMRRALAGAADRIEGGADWRDALLATGLVRPSEHALLGTAQDVGNLPWALRAVAQRAERVLAYRLTTLVQVAYPLAMLLLGLVVAFFVVSMFLPLVLLVQSLT